MLVTKDDSRINSLLTLHLSSAFKAFDSDDPAALRLQESDSPLIVPEVYTFTGVANNIVSGTRIHSRTISQQLLPVKVRDALRRDEKLSQSQRLDPN